MLQHLDTITPFVVKVSIPLGIMIATSAADIVTDAKGVRELGFLGAVIVALLFVVRAFLQEQAKREADRDKHEAQMKATWDAHKEEMKELAKASSAAMDRQAEALTKLSSLTEEQTGYFRSVTRNIVDEKLNGKKPHIPT